MNKIILFILIIITVLYYLGKKNNISQLITYVNPDKICILLTTSVDYSKPDRINMYNSVINDYLENTKLNIYIVNSSTNKYFFPEFQNNPRIFIYSFIQQENGKSSTYYEAISILNAFNYFNLNKFDYIIKITGRYYIHNIEELINKIPEETEVIYQNNHLKIIKIISQNSEIFGCKTIYLEDIMTNIINSNDIFENNIKKLIYKYKCFRLPKIFLTKPVRRGGDKILMKYL